MELNAKNLEKLGLLEFKKGHMYVKVPKNKDVDNCRLKWKNFFNLDDVDFDSLRNYIEEAKKQK
jgi:hypothetical protein